MTDDPTPEVKSLRYAEGLGLNSVWEESLVKRQALSEKVLDLSNARNRKRELEAYKTDLEMAATEEEYSKHPDLSVAAMERHLKLVFSNHAEIRETKDEITVVVGQVELLEHEIMLLKTDIEIAVARLHELGGYFQFMAVIKQAEITRKATESKGPW